MPGAKANLSVDSPEESKSIGPKNISLLQLVRLSGLDIFERESFSLTGEFASFVDVCAQRFQLVALGFGSHSTVRTHRNFHIYRPTFQIYGDTMSLNLRRSC